MSRVKINRKELVPFITKDKSEIRELLSPRDSRTKNQSLAEALVLPGEQTTWHYHKTSEEIYFILQGSGLMQFKHGEDIIEYRVAKEDAILIEPGRIHRIVNLSMTKPLRFLCICSPAYEHEDTVLVD